MREARGDSPRALPFKPAKRKQRTLLRSFCPPAPGLSLSVTSVTLKTSGKCSRKCFSPWSKDPPTDERMKRLWYIHTVEYYLGMKRTEAQAPATMWMNLENMTLSERSQTQNAAQYTIPFIENVQHGQVRGDRTQVHGCRCWGGGGTDDFTGTLFRRDENALEPDGGGGCTTLRTYVTPPNGSR